MPEPIRLDEWLAELSKDRAAVVEGPEGFTVQEVAEKLGIGHRAAGYRVRDWALAGLVEFVGRRRETSLTGNPVLVPVYLPTSR